MIDKSKSDSGFGIELVLRAAQSNRRELLQTLEEFKRRLADAEDLRRCDFFESVTDTNVFLWTEWWPDEARAREEQDTERFRALLGAVRLLGDLRSMRDLEGTRHGPDDDPETNTI